MRERVHVQERVLHVREGEESRRAVFIEKYVIWRSPCPDSLEQ